MLSLPIHFNACSLNQSLAGVNNDAGKYSPIKIKA